MRLLKRPNRNKIAQHSRRQKALENLMKAAPRVLSSGREGDAVRLNNEVKTLKKHLGV